MWTRFVLVLVVGFGLLYGGPVHAAIAPADPNHEGLLLRVNAPSAGDEIHLDPNRSQQVGGVRGRVVAEATGHPLRGAEVFIERLNRGALTDPSGNYQIANVPAGNHTIRARMFGYETGRQQVRVEPGQEVVADFTLAQQAIDLDEIVVTGAAGEQRRREMGTSMGTVGRQALEVTPMQNVQDVLYGRSPGVLLMANSGQPGAAATIRLRGNNSVSGGNEPLIYVDGVRLFNEAIQDGAHIRSGRQGISAFNSIRPEDIERMEIIKGAAATTLYGTQASGGVIQIFTRRGSEGPARWSMEIATGVNQLGYIGPSDEPLAHNLRDCVNYENSLGQQSTDPTCPADGNWLRNGLIQRYNLSVSGGSSAMSYYLSGSFSEEADYIKGGGSDRPLGLRGNFTFRPIEGLSLTLNSSYSGRATSRRTDGNAAGAFLINVARGPFGRYIIDGQPHNRHALEQRNTNDTDHFLGGVTAQYASGAWSHRITVGYDFFSTVGETLWPWGNPFDPSGRFDRQHNLRTTLTGDYVSSLQLQVTPDVTSRLSVGGQWFREEDQRQYVRGFEFAGPGYPTMASAARTEVVSDRDVEVVNAGLFVQNILGFRERAYLTLGLRVDGNSAFGDDFGLQAYPKAGISYVLSEHGFWPVDSWESFRLRAAVGEAGRAPGPFDAVQTWQPVSAEDGQPGFTPANLGNPNLGPERTREYEVGFESSALGGRLGVEFTYFHQDTYDALLPVRAPPSTGFGSTQLENVGHLRNRGLELQLRSGWIRLPSVDWTTMLNVSTNWSEAVDLGGQIISTGVRSSVREGYPVPAFIGDWPSNPHEFADPIIEEDVYKGPLYPPYIIGLHNSLVLLGSITLDVMGEWQLGHWIENGTGRQQTALGGGMWRPCFAAQAALRAAAQGDPTALDGFTALERLRCDPRNSYEWWHDRADFFRLRSASLTFELPDRLLPGRADRATLQVSGRNLFTRTGYGGLDPEAGDQGAVSMSRWDYFVSPPPRTFVASLRVHF
jgi:TonB-dependent starch-binding outer membrane protein SusC